MPHPGGWQTESRGISAPFMVNNGDGITLIIKAALTVQPLAVHSVVAVDAQQLKVIPAIDYVVIVYILRRQMFLVMDDEVRRLNGTCEAPVLAAFADVIL